MCAACPPFERQAGPNFWVLAETGGGMVTLTVMHGFTPASAVRCIDVLAAHLGDGTQHLKLQYIDDPVHPLLRQYCDEQVELHFSGKPTNLAAMLGDLWIAHRQIVGDWIPFARHCNKVPLDQLLGVGFGSFALGPRFLLEAYAAVLTRYGSEPSFAPTQIDGTRPQPPPREALNLGGGAYVIASAYEVAQGGVKARMFSS